MKHIKAEAIGMKHDDIFDIGGYSRWGDG